MAHRLQRATDDRVVAGSNPIETAWTFWTVCFKRDTKTKKQLVSSKFYLVSMPGEVKDPTQVVNM